MLANDININLYKTFSPTGRGEDTINEVDALVGQRVRERRIYLGISQHKLAAKIGVTFQQLQKYESGANRISASRLYFIAKALNCSIEYIFEPATVKELQIITPKLSDQAIKMAAAFDKMNESEQDTVKDLCQNIAKLRRYK